MLSKLFPSMLHYRENRIREQAQRHLNGKLSYHEALEDSQSNGIREWFSNAINGGSPMPESQIHAQFDAELMNSQLENSIHNFDMLMYHVLNPELSLSDPSCYQRFFSNIEVSNSQCELRLSFTVHNNSANGLVMTLTKYDRNTNNIDKTFKPKIHSIPNYDIYELRDVLIEHAIYQHKQYGIAIPDSVKDLLDEQSRINIYLEEATLSQPYGISFSGGGAKGVLNAGALEGLGEYRLANVRKVSGASAGAIVASIISSGMKPYEFTEFMHKASLDITQDELIAVVRKTMLTTIRKRLHEFNLNRNSSEMDHREIYWINKYNSPQPSLTFNDLHQLKLVFPDLGFKELFLTATHFSDNDPVGVELSVHTSPNMDIAKAVAASAALPLWFAKVDATRDLLPETKRNLKVKDGESVKLQDGGIVKNNPADLLFLTTDTRGLSINPFYVDESIIGDNFESKNDDCSYSEDSKHDESKEKLNVAGSTSNTAHILCLGFEDSEGLHEVSPSFIERASCFVVGTDKMLGYQRYETYMLKNYNTHFLPIYGIGIIDFKPASRKFVKITQNSKNNFTEWEFNNRGKMKSTSLPTKKLHTQRFLLREVFALHFGGNEIEKQVLTKKRIIPMGETTYGESTLFDELRKAHENNNYQEFNRLYQQMRQEIARLQTKMNVLCWEAL